MLLSIILPIYNQADHLETLVLEYERVLSNLPHAHEMLLVTNGCTDDSVAVADRLAGTHPGVRAIHHDRAGWGSAVRRGLREARGDILCFTNSARTAPQDLQLALLYAVVNGVVVKANRKIRESVVRRLGSLLYNLQIRSLFDLSMWDINGTPKVFPRTFDKLLALSREDNLIDAEFNVICQRQGYQVLELPIFSTRRHGGRSTTSFRTALGLYWGAFMFWRQQKERR